MKDYEFYRQKFLDGRKIKRRELRLLKREKDEEPGEYISRGMYLREGSVWGIEDKSVSFDTPRDPDVLKEGLRPCLCLDTPDQYNYYSPVEMAPGTTKFHRTDLPDMPTLAVQINPKSDYQTTYFLIYASWYAMQKTLQKHFTDLKESDFAEMKRLRGFYGQTAD